eukprot:4218296-Amphidinium_carterae.1
MGGLTVKAASSCASQGSSLWRESETSVSHLYVCEGCEGFAQLRWASLKLPCKGTPSMAGRTALRRIWRAEHPARGMKDTGWFWSQGPLDTHPEDSGQKVDQPSGAIR